jgi:hypothetical protein
MYQRFIYLDKFEEFKRGFNEKIIINLFFNLCIYISTKGIKHYHLGKICAF